MHTRPISLPLSPLPRGYPSTPIASNVELAQRRLRHALVLMSGTMENRAYEELLGLRAEVLESARALDRAAGEPGTELTELYRGAAKQARHAAQIIGRTHMLAAHTIPDAGGIPADTESDDLIDRLRTAQVVLMSATKNTDPYEGGCADC